MAQRPLVLVPYVSVQPRHAFAHQVCFDRNMLDGNQFDQPAYCIERFTRADRHEDVIAFNCAHVRLCGKGERPSQIGFVSTSPHGHRPLVIRIDSQLPRSTLLIPQWRNEFRIRAAGLPPIAGCGPLRELLRSSAGHSIRIVITCREFSTVPTGRPPVSYLRLS